MLIRCAGNSCTSKGTKQRMISYGRGASFGCLPRPLPFGDLNDKTHNGSDPKKRAGS